ncbi:hypothetical protein HYDPIDRAFT_113243 [Hydnomerulius pinastri MD-312]|uniref:Uncharacterized protein n=1 Tax=Hydnomerulius pinastri MD-312 TaxID=994086 RepID=A0A0C9VCE4_9AGAM|nr:hypothetical protein HYDPIDRAFT_113243 [Hydnomerulius pinastri MD-312]
MVLYQTHPLYPPATYADLIGRNDQEGSAHVGDLNGPAPLSPVLMGALPEYLGGRPTPPPSPPRCRATDYNGHTFDAHAPCPPTPPLVPYDVNPNELNWADEFESNVDTGASTYGGTRTSMPLSELNAHTFFGSPSTYQTTNDFGYVAQYDDAEVPVSTEVHEGSAVDASLWARRGNPVLVMIKRAELDQEGSHPDSIPVEWQAPNDVEDFAATGGIPPKTSNETVDEQTDEFYSLQPFYSLLRQEDSYAAYHYSVRAVEGLQHSLRSDYHFVYPKPMPAVLIRTFDIIGPCDLRRKQDGYAYVLPTEDTIWGTVLERGIDRNFRPLANGHATSDAVTIQTNVSVNGAAMYHPHEIVASKFAVNVFLELPRMPGETLENPYTQYLGAYVLRVIDGYTIRSEDWMDIAPEVKDMVRDRAPHLFEGFWSPHRTWPCLPLVQFCFYKWDENIVGLADEIHLDLQYMPAKEAIALGGEEEDDASDDEEEQRSHFSDDSEDDSGYDGHSTRTGTVALDNGNVASPAVGSWDLEEEFASFLEMDRSA